MAKIEEGSNTTGNHPIRGVHFDWDEVLSFAPPHTQAQRLEESLTSTDRASR